MKELTTLLDRIGQRANINLRDINFDVPPYIRNLVPLDQMVKFYAFYGITPHHPLDFHFRHSSLAGSYFLGKCRAVNSILYKSDIRGDELKQKGDVFRYKDFEIPILMDEGIEIEDSFLIKTLVHNFSHDPKTLERFFIKDTVSAHYANIHGSPCDGCFLGPLATVDLTTMHDSTIGAFSYVQTGEIAHLNVGPGTVWIRSPGEFNFLYRHPLHKLDDYVSFSAGRTPQGFIVDFVEDRKEAFQKIFDVVNIEPSVPVPRSASLDRYAVIKPKTQIGENVLVAQRAYLQNASLGKGSNAQENCYIVNSRLAGNNVTAHGAKIIESDLEPNVFVGFNSFLRGRADCRLTIGKDSIVLPHTIIDIRKPMAVPPEHFVWGLINNQADLISNSMAFSDFCKIDGDLVQGNLVFEGEGPRFVTAFRERINHILEANGAFFDGTANRGHAQRNQRISFNTIQPYPDGDLEGLYPTIIIQP
jgi:carbonic anhydrase/acetyltransferase-like protein (isoleucine patch superfamily)